MKNSQKTPDQKISFTNRFLVGLVITLGFSLTAFEWTTVTFEEDYIGEPITYLDDEVILDPLRFRIEETIKPKPIIEKKTLVMTVVKVFTEPEIKDPEIDSEPETPILIGMEEGLYGNMDDDLPDEKLPRDYAEYFAHYDNCAGLASNELYLCTTQDIINRIKANFIVPHELKYESGEKKAFVEFVVETNGEITNIKVKLTNHPKMGEASVSALKKLPKMNPAIQNGRKVALKMTVPISLIINP